MCPYTLRICGFLWIASLCYSSVNYWSYILAFYNSVCVESWESNLARSGKCYPFASTKKLILVQSGRLACVVVNTEFPQIYSQALAGRHESMETVCLSGLLQLIYPFWKACDKHNCMFSMHVAIHPCQFASWLVKRYWILIFWGYSWGEGGGWSNRILCWISLCTVFNVQ